MHTRPVLFVLVFTYSAVTALFAQRAGAGSVESFVDLPDEIGNHLLSGDIGSLEAYVAQHGDFRDKRVPDTGLGDVGIEFLVAFLPFAGFDSEASDEHLFAADPELIESIAERNELVARFVFDHGGDPDKGIDAGFGEVNYLGLMHIALADYAEQDRVAVENAGTLVEALARVFIEYGAGYGGATTSVMSLFVPAVLDLEDLFSLALESGADPSARIEGISAGSAYLMSSFQLGEVNPSYVRRLFEQPSVIEPLVDGVSPVGISWIGAAVSLGLESLVERFLEEGQGLDGVHYADQGWGIAHIAAASGAVETLEVLIARGAPVGAVAGSLTTALHVVSEDRGGEIVPILVAAGADLEAKDGYDLTPYQGAMLDGRSAVAAALRLAGAQALIPEESAAELLITAFDRGAGSEELTGILANVADPAKLLATEVGLGRTIFHEAFYSQLPTAAYLALLDFGGNPFTLDWGGESPFQVVALSSDHYELLERMVADPRSLVFRDEAKRGVIHYVAAYRTELLSTTLAVGHSVDIYDIDGMTPLAFASAYSRHGALPSVLLLLERGADVYSVDRFGFTALMHTARRGDRDAFEALIDAGAEIGAIDGNGQSVLCHAAAGGDPSIVASLIDAGIDVDSGGPLVHAAFAGNDEAISLLLAAGADPDAEAAVYRSDGDRFDLIGVFTPLAAAQRQGYRLESLDRR